jgi:hypothetical protein
VKAVDRFLCGAEPAARLQACVTWFAVLMGARIAFGPYRGLVGQPAALFEPPWFLTWLDTVPGMEWIVAMQVAGTAAALLAALGHGRRVTFAIAWATLLVLAGLRASRGKIQHNDVLLLLAAAPFLAAAAETSWRDTRVGSRFGWPIRTGMAVVAMGYFFSGITKLETSGHRWMLSDNMQNVLHDGARSPKTHAPDLAHWIGDQGSLSRAIAVATIVFEIGFPLALVFARLRPVAVAGAVLIHASIFVLLGLDYSAWAGAAVILFVDWSRYSIVIARSGQLSAPSPACSARAPSTSATRISQ